MWSVTLDVEERLEKQETSVRLCVVVFADQLIHRLGIVNSAAVDRPQNVFINISLCTSHSD